jgi:hypothetical protein
MTPTCTNQNELKYAKWKSDGKWWNGNLVHGAKGVIVQYFLHFTYRQNYLMYRIIIVALKVNIVNLI